MCLDTAGCGWCPTVNKCVPKVNNYPIIPRATSAEVTSTIRLNDPLFQCPITTFVKTKDQCSDVLCSSLTTCRDCTGNIKCGWCADSRVCLPKDANNNIIVPAGTTCAAATAVRNSGECPNPACNTITDCVECVNTTGCSFCEEANKCVRFRDKTQRNNDGTARVIEARDPAVTGCTEENAITSPTQCPAVRATQRRGPLLPSRRDSTPTTPDDASALADELAAAQDNTVGGAALTDAQDNSARRPATQTVRSTDGPASPATIYDFITAPGSARRVGSTSMTESYPAAAGLPSEGPFEEYIKMLVRSELSSEGIPHTEQFQDGATPQPRSRPVPYQVREEDVLPNAAQYVRTRAVEILQAPKKMLM